MKSKILIQTEGLATRILMDKNAAAKAIPKNVAKLYVVEDVFDPRSLIRKSTVVWAVKTGKTHYMGILLRSGIKENDKAPISNAVRVEFDDFNIVKELSENDFAENYLQIKCSKKRRQLYLYKTIEVPQEQEAKEILYKKFPETQGLPLIMLRTRKFYGPRQNAFWAVWSGYKYKAINPYSGEAIVFTPEGVRNEMVVGERLDGDYRLVKGYYGLRIYLSPVISSQKI